MDLPNYPWRIPNQLAAGIEQADRPMTYSKLAQVLDIIEQERSPRFDIRHLHCPSVVQVCLLGANAASAEVLVEQFIAVSLHSEHSTQTNVPRSQFTFRKYFNM